MKDKLDIIKKHHPYFNLQLILKAELLDREATRAEIPTLKINTEKGSFYLHSKYDPLKEAGNLIKNFKAEEHDVIVMLGLGLGYHLFELVKKYPDNLFMVIEHDNNIYRTFFETANHDFIEKKNILYLTDDNFPELSHIISYFIHTRKKSSNKERKIKIRIFKHTPSINLYLKIYKEIEERLLDVVSNYYSNILTEEKLKNTWERNIKKNIKYFKSSLKLKDLKNKYRKKPMVIICAGPSLEEKIGFLKENSKKMVLVSVDTSLRYLIKNKIFPDYVLSLDAGYENLGDFKFLDREEGIELIYDIVSFPMIPQMFRRKYVTYTLRMVKDFYSGKWIERHDYYIKLTIEKYGDFGGLQSGGSVATNALDFALFSGADPIYFAGLDLKYINYKTHCRGTYKEKYLLNRTNRFYNYETLSFITVVTRKNIRKVEGNDLYHYDFILRKYQQWFDDAFSMIKDREIIRL